MSWAKVDDQLHAHRKAKLAWKYHPRALGLHLLALSYCAGHLTDGFVDLEFVEEKLPAGRERDNVTSALVNAGLWVAVDGGWMINDWLEYNPSRADILAKRRADADRKARRRGVESTEKPNGLPKESKRTPRGLRTESVAPRAGAPAGASRPDPSNPLPPRPPVGGRARDKLAWEENIAAWVAGVGVLGDGPTVLRALEQAKPWQRNGDAADYFRGFVTEYFPKSLTVEAPA